HLPVRFGGLELDCHRGIIADCAAARPARIITRLQSAQRRRSRPRRASPANTHPLQPPVPGCLLPRKPVRTRRRRGGPTPEPFASLVPAVRPYPFPEAGFHLQEFLLCISAPRAK